MTRRAEVQVPANPGTYVLVLFLRSARHVKLGGFGSFTLRAGYYLYVGSAFGPGGLQARIRHHLHVAEHPRWHIDYLRKESTPVEVWFSTYEEPLEHEWARMLRSTVSLTVPVRGFGSSDCLCESHLFHSSAPPSIAELKKRWFHKTRRHINFQARAVGSRG